LLFWRYSVNDRLIAKQRVVAALRCCIMESDAGVVELVDAPDSKSGSARSVGSIPTARTNFDLYRHPDFRVGRSASLPPSS
jgi:hypothetical protein